MDGESMYAMESAMADCKNELRADLEKQILKLEDTVNLIWHELKNLNTRVENLANSHLAGVGGDDGK